MIKISSKEYFPTAIKIPDELFLEGNLKHLENKRLTIVGSRKPSLYGKMVVEKLISEIKDLPISIVSGLAIGIDSLAHEMALKYNVHTIAVPGSGLLKSCLYPKSNIVLANRILENGGALLSPWEAQPATIWTFPTRNSVMAAISDFVLIIEAREDSGTMITARETIKRNIKLGAVPGNIDSLFSSGPNRLIKNGAILVSSIDDIISEIGISRTKLETRKLSGNHPILKHLSEPRHRDALSQISGIDTSELNAELTMLEIFGEIKIDSSGVIRLA